MPSFYEDAMDYHSRGWSIIPIGVDTKKPPRGFTWKQYQISRPSESQIRKWFTEGEGKLGGLAVVLGDVSDLICRDFDTMESYIRWEAAHAKLAATLPTVATARGRHVYFRSSYRGYVDLGDGELRGDSGHYCLLPPSQHPDGPTYRWLNPLPEGALPVVDDIAAAGLLGTQPPATERTEENGSNRRGGGRGLLCALCCSPPSRSRY